MSAVLVIDSDISSRESIRMILGEEHDVFVCSSEKQALPILRDNAIDLVLLDVSDRPEDSISLVKWIQENNTAIEVIILSASSEAKAVREASEFGAMDYILKPFPVDKLRFVVDRALQILSLKNELEKLRTLSIDDDMEELVGNKSLKEATEELEKQMIEEALEKTGHVQTRASQLLKTTRRILCYKMKILGIDK